jgi:hypothetical protein
VPKEVWNARARHGGGTEARASVDRGHYRPHAEVGYGRHQARLYRRQR